MYEVIRKRRFGFIRYYENHYLGTAFQCTVYLNLMFI